MVALLNELRRQVKKNDPIENSDFAFEPYKAALIYGLKDVSSTPNNHKRICFNNMLAHFLYNHALLPISLESLTLSAESIFSITDQLRLTN